MGHFELVNGCYTANVQVKTHIFTFIDLFMIYGSKYRFEINE